MWFYRRITILIAAATLAPAAYATDTAVAGPSSSLQAVHALPRKPAIEQRLEVLTKELELTAAQQAEVRRILVRQQLAVRQVWSNSTIDPLERAAATQSVTEHTGEAIRAILNEEQKKKYNLAKPDAPVEAGSQRSVEDWMHEMGSH